MPGAVPVGGSDSGRCGPSCTIGRDVRTDRAAPRAARHQLPGPRGAFGLHRRVRPGRFTPGERRGGRRRPFHGAHHVQGHGGLPDDARDQRGDRGCRRFVQRRHRPRIDRLLGPRPDPRGDPGDGRPGRADRPPHPEHRRDRGRAQRHHRGDPRLPGRSGRICPDPVPDRDVRRRPARARDLRRRGRHPGTPGRHDPRVLADHLSTRQHRDRRRRRPRARTGRRPRHDRVRDRQWRRPGRSRRRPPSRPASACWPASGSRRRRSSSSVSRPCAGITRMRGRWRS